jgi:hypothetical protein
MQSAVIESIELISQRNADFSDVLLIIFSTHAMVLVFIVRSIMFSIEPNPTAQKAQAPTRTRARCGPALFTIAVVA